MRILFFGSGDFGAPTLQALVQARHQIVHVVTQPAKPAGRGRHLQTTPIAQLAQKLNLPCTECPNVNDPHFVQLIRSWQPQLILVIAFAQKIGPEILNLPDTRTINLHASLLPQLRGAAPINWAIIQGLHETGLTIFELNEQWDAGAILGRLATPIKPAETAGELHDRLAALGPQLLLPIVDAIAQGQDQPVPQIDTQATRAPKLKKADALLDFSLPAQQLANRIHGLWPWPGAYSFLHSQRVTFARVLPRSDKDPNRQPGQLDQNLAITCGQGSLLPLKLKPDNSRLMNYDEFIRGRHLTPTDQFRPNP